MSKTSDIAVAVWGIATAGLMLHAIHLINNLPHQSIPVHAPIEHRASELDQILAISKEYPNAQAVLELGTASVNINRKDIPQIQAFCEEYNRLKALDNAGQLAGSSDLDHKNN